MHTSKKRFCESLRKSKGLSPRADVISHSTSDIGHIVIPLYVCLKKKKKSLQHLHLSAQTAVVNCLFICAHLFCYECHSDKLPNPINTNIIMFSCIKCPMKATTNSQSKPNEEHEMLYFKITSNQTHSYHKHPCWAHFSSYILVHVFSSRVTVIFTNTAWSESSWSLI